MLRGVHPLLPKLHAMDNQPLLQTCEELLEILYAHRDHAKLRALIGDIEDLRDRLLREAAVTHAAGAA